VRALLCPLRGLRAASSGQGRESDSRCWRVWALEKSLIGGGDEVRKAVLVCAWDEKDEGVFWVSRSWLGREGCWGPASSLVKLAATRALDEARGLGGDFDIRFREMQPRRAMVRYKSRGADVGGSWFGNAWSRGERERRVFAMSRVVVMLLSKEELELGGFGRCGRGC